MRKRRPAAAESSISLSTSAESGMSTGIMHYFSEGKTPSFDTLKNIYNYSLLLYFYSRRINDV